MLVIQNELPSLAHHRLPGPPLYPVRPQPFARFLLLAGERFDRDFKVARHPQSRAVAVQADELAQERDRELGLPAGVRLLKEYLVRTERVMSSSVLIS